ncbi:Uncharacterized protein Fot_04870 [Forsythia ovata]|uniref:Ubiquitin-like domain-containing protein n=1 Tax=Forsythia ovata TaxID=205694 RepID=A0ABD1WNI5_9LAMI
MGGGDAGAAANDGGDSIENDGSKGGEVMVNIRCSNGSKFSVHVSLDSTVESFKSILAQNCEIPPQQQRLIYKGRILKDDHTLQSYEPHIVQKVIQLLDKSKFKTHEFVV